MIVKFKTHKRLERTCFMGWLCHDTTTTTNIASFQQLSVQLFLFWSVVFIFQNAGSYLLNFPFILIMHDSLNNDLQLFLYYN